MDLKRIDELSSGLEWYLKQLSNFTSEMKEVRDALRELRESHERSQNYEVQKLQQQIAALTEAFKQQGIIPPNVYEIELESLRGLIGGSEWPQAIPEERICLTSGKHIERANGILNIFVSEYLKDKKFLDFGCGEGHVVAAAKKNEASLAIGYDIKNQWEDASNLTPDWTEIQKNAPYDVILLHDVLDHIEMYDPIEALKKVKSVMSPDGHIYVRNHPWSSRHGGHLYLRKNLAFLHLVFDSVELTRIGGLEAEYNIKVHTPLETYRYWFEQADLKIDSEIATKTPVEDFFKKTAVVYGRLAKHWGEGQDPFGHMEIDFVEYVVSSGVSDHQIL